ncbi:MAG: histidinol-phosphate transaminase [Actinomycetes bacterium]
MTKRRDDLRELSGYHSPQVEAKVRLNTNESAFVASDALVAEAMESLPGILANLNRYPDREALALRAAIAKMHGLGSERIFCANGSNEILQLILLAYGGPGRKALVFEPTYALHSQIARITGTQVVFAARNEDFGIDRDVALAAIKDEQPEVIFLCSPNNPTGNVDSRELLREILGASDALVVLDEAYVQFADEAISDVLGGASERLLVVRTFSKTWALAGLRLGYVLAAPQVVDDLQIVALPYHLSAITQALGMIAVGHLEDMEASIALIRSERERVSTALIALGAQLWPSQANFILFRPRMRPARALWKALVDSSVLIRDFSQRDDLEDCLRVTIGTAAENSAFLAAYEEADHD